MLAGTLIRGWEWLPRVFSYNRGIKTCTVLVFLQYRILERFLRQCDYICWRRECSTDSWEPTWFAKSTAGHRLAAKLTKQLLHTLEYGRRCRLYTESIAIKWWYCSISTKRTQRRYLGVMLNEMRECCTKWQSSNNKPTSIALREKWGTGICFCKLLLLILLMVE